MPYGHSLLLPEVVDEPDRPNDDETDVPRVEVDDVMAVSTPPAPAVVVAVVVEVERPRAFEAPCWLSSTTLVAIDRRGRRRDTVGECVGVWVCRCAVRVRESVGRAHGTQARASGQRSLASRRSTIVHFNAARRSKPASVGSTRAMTSVVVVEDREDRAQRSPWYAKAWSGWLVGWCVVQCSLPVNRAPLSRE